MTYPLANPRYYLALFRDLLTFIKNPESERKSIKSVKWRVYDTIGLYILKLILLIPVLLFFALIYDPENIQKANMAARLSPVALLMVGGLILPLLEEVAFRLSLRFRPSFLALSLGVFCYYLLTKLIYHTKVSLVDESFAMRVGASLLASLLIYLLVRLESVKQQLASFWDNHFSIIYYATCLVFAWIHVSKYELTLLNILLLPILTLPQLLSAVIYGYIRISFGFQYPLVFHSCTNVIAISLSLLPLADLAIS